MNASFHYATCHGWVSGRLSDCNCRERVAWWRIRYEGGPFPWRIWALSADHVTYDPVMRASSWTYAMKMVDQMILLRAQGDFDVR